MSEIPEVPHDLKLQIPGSPENIEAVPFELGLQATFLSVKQKLSQNKRRPMVVFVNGLTGVGKASFSFRLEDLLNAEQISVAHIETDLYLNDRFSGEDFLEHKQAWEQGRPFTRHNLRTRQDEAVEQKPDVVIISGSGAAEEHVGARADLSVLLVADPLVRLARRITRDHVKKSGITPDPRKFLKDLSDPPEGETDLLSEFEQHRGELGKLRQKPDLVIDNSKLTGTELKFEILDDSLHFVAEHLGVKYDVSEPISPDRRDRLKHSLGL